MIRGKFIVLEGPDGVGKTTQCQQLVHWLNENHEPAVLTQGLGGSTFLGDTLRTLMLQPNSEGMACGTRVYLSLADRRQHLVDFVGPALADGVHAVCDRGWLSNVVYQGWAGGYGWRTVHDLEYEAASGNCSTALLWPDLTLVLGCDGALGRAQDPNYFEGLGAEFAQRLVEGYREVAICKGLPWIDASQSPAAVFSDILAHVTALLEEPVA